MQTSQLRCRPKSSKMQNLSPPNTNGWNPLQVLRIGRPSWLSGKESACQCKRLRFDPWSKKILHAAKQVSLCATTCTIRQRFTTTIEPRLYSLRITATELHTPETLCSTTREATAMKPVQPRSPQLGESPDMKTQHGQK